MSNSLANTDKIETIYRACAPKAKATLIRLLNDFDLAEEVLHDAFLVALEDWPRLGVPDRPEAWLISTARFKAIDTLRRGKRFNEMTQDIGLHLEELHQFNARVSGQTIEDDQLRLIFTCCHPSIDSNVQIPLTLREVCGLTTEEIASAFLVTPSTMAQRIVRGKAKIRKAKIPFNIPEKNALAERLDAVLAVIYLVFNEGYCASEGEALIRLELANEAIRLARLLESLLPDPEVSGLLALMLLHQSRRETRHDVHGDIVLLEDQDRSRWDQALIQEGSERVRVALRSGRIGTYSLQAAIAAVHAEANVAEQTDWAQIYALYTVLLQVNPSPIIELNRAVALAMRDNFESGIRAIDAILERGQLQNYHLAHSAKAELLLRAGRESEALAAFQLAHTLVNQGAERRFIERRIDSLKK